MNDLIHIKGNRVFTLAEAESLLPVIYRLTDEASREVKKLFQCVETLPNKTSPRAQELEANIDALIVRWQRKIERLGAKPKGLWLADFDHGKGYWCWKFPETKIGHTHGYQDGFSGRMIVDHETNRNHPI